MLGKRCGIPLGSIRDVLRDTSDVVLKISDVTVQSKSSGLLHDTHLDTQCVVHAGVVRGERPLQRKIRRGS